LPYTTLFRSTVLELYQAGPLTGGSITASGDVADLLGTPISTPGVAAAPAVPARYVVSGADFGTGTEVTAAGRVGMLYEILSISGNTITVSPPGVEFCLGFLTAFLAPPLQSRWIGSRCQAAGRAPLPQF